MANDTKNLEREISSLAKETTRSADTVKELTRTLSLLVRQIEKVVDRLSQQNELMRNAK